MLAIFVIPIIANGCTSSPSDKNGSDLSGTITISGAWALYPMVIRWSEEYQKIYPDVNFDISAGGAGKGMADALAGAVDLGMVSRAVYPEEIENGAFDVAVVKDAVFPTVSDQNPMLEELKKTGMTQEELIGIFISGDINNWGTIANTIDNNDPIHVYTRSDACGAAATWAEYLGGKAQEDLLGLGIYGDPGILDAVVKDPLGIGYNNLNYLFDSQTGKPVAGSFALPIDINNNGSIDPNEIYLTKQDAVNAVANGDYPSPPARDLHLVTNGEPQGLVKTFLIWVLTDGQQFVDPTGYIEIPEDQLQKELAKLN